MGQEDFIESVDAVEVDCVYKSTNADKQAMRRLGRSQELVRHYNFLSMLSFVIMATSSWQLTLFSATPALIDGGLPNFVWSVIWCVIGFIPILLTMAEMSSMAPIAGAQYHWVSEFAPKNCQRILSFVTGWISTVAWQAGNASGLFLAGTLIQAIISINVPDYTSPNWHASLFALCMIVLATLVNVYGSETLPHIQTPVFIASMAIYVAMFSALWARGPKATSEQVWLEWTNSGGWSSMALSVMIGQLPALTAFMGIDTAVHMAEEVKSATNVLPKVLLSALAVNFVQAFLTTVTMAYHLPDLKSALEDPSTYPAIYMMRKAMPLPWLTCLLVLICFTLMVGNMSWLAAVSRDLFAFARDNGLPFSSWICKVDQKKRIPVNAYIVSGTLCTLLSLIYIGSPVAFYAITSLSAIAAGQCYLFSIGCLLWRKIRHPETQPKAHFSLGKWGIPVNLAAFVFSFWTFFWSAWPQTYPFTPGGFNWASVIFAASLSISLIYYEAHGKKKYFGPVVLVQGRKL